MPSVEQYEATQPQQCACGCGQETTLARRTDRLKGHIKGQPHEWLPGHHLYRGRRSLGFNVIPLARQIAYKIYRRGDCWEWRGGRTGAQYGAFWDYPFGLIFAHRLCYELAKGPIPPELELDHLCSHPWCVKPSHLEPVTTSENVRRGLRRRGWYRLRLV